MYTHTHIHIYTHVYVLIYLFTYKYIPIYVYIRFYTCIGLNLITSQSNYIHSCAYVCRRKNSIICMYICV